MENIRAVKKIIAAICPVDQQAASRAKEALATLHAGRLGDLVVQLASIQGNRREALSAAFILACGDHGVAKRQVSAYPPETTAQMVVNYTCFGGACANVAAAFNQAAMQVLDVGVDAELGELPGLRNCKIARGTRDMTREPAMTKNQAVRAIYCGMESVWRARRQGANCFTMAEMGIGNTTSSAAIIAAFTGLSPKQVTGRGTGISDARLLHKQNMVAQALEQNKPNKNDGLDVLAKVGGLETGALVGVILAAAAEGCPVVLDGLNTAAAALIACQLAPAAQPYLVASQLSAEPAHAAALRYLGLEGWIVLNLRLGEGAGAALALRILVSAWELLRRQEEFCK